MVTYIGNIVFLIINRYDGLVAMTTSFAVLCNLCNGIGKADMCYLKFGYTFAEGFSIVFISIFCCCCS